MSKLMPRERDDENPKTESVEIRVTPEEKTRWKKEAKGRSLSQYIRDKMNGKK